MRHHIKTDIRITILV